MRVVYEEGDLAIVTTKSGRKYVAVYTLAPGIDYFWNPVIEGTGGNALSDPEVHTEYLGRKHEV